jgi:hypothetical protein
MKENQQLTLRLLMNNAFRATDPELTAIVQSLSNVCPLLFQSLLSRSEMDSLNEQTDEDEDEIDLTADPLHSQPRAIGCIRPKHVRLQLGFPVSHKRWMLLSQWTLRRFIGETTAAQTCSTSEKPPFSGARSWFLLIGTYVCSLSL